MTRILRALNFRILGVILLGSAFVFFVSYSRNFYAGFIAECRNIDGADLNAAGNGAITIDLLYAFLIGALPLALSSRTGVHIMVGLFLFFDLMAFSEWVFPYPGSDCGITTGNTENFTGSYVVFELGYGLLIIAIYLILAADLAVRGMHSLRRRLKKQA